MQKSRVVVDLNSFESLMEIYSYMGSRLLYTALELWHWNCTTLWIFDEVGFAINLFLGFYDRLPITDQKKMIEYQNKAIHVKKQTHA